MRIRTTIYRALLFVGIPLCVTVVGGYIVERIKGNPPDEIAAGIWHPFGTVIGGIETGLDGALTWFRAPAQLTHFGVSVLLATFAWLAFVLLRFTTRLNRVDRLVFYDSLGDLTRKITELQDMNRRVAGGERDGTAVVRAPNIAEGFEPSRIQLLAGKVLVDQYPKRMQLPGLAAAMARLTGGGSFGIAVPVAPQGEIARQMEELHGVGIAAIKDPDSAMAYYGLTREGRNFILGRLAVPTKPAQPAAQRNVSALRSLENKGGPD